MDFGSAKWDDDAVEVIDGAPHTSTILGSMPYHPPELNAPKKQQKSLYDPRPFDVWCVGLVMFFLVFLEEMGNLRLGFYLFSKILKKEPGFAGLLDSKERGEDGVPRHKAFWAKYPDLDALFAADEGRERSLKHLFNSIFDINPKTRATIYEVARHPWFDLETPSNAEYRAEMESRPTNATIRDRVIPIPACVRGEHETEEGFINKLRSLIVEACLPMADASGDAERRKQLNSILEYHARYTLFLVGNNPVFFSARYDADTSTLTCRWLRGNLQQWFTFFYGLEKELEAYAE